MMRILFSMLLATTLILPVMSQNTNDNYPINHTEKEWKELLSDKEYHVLREKGTERAFVGEYDKFYVDGEYSCAACQAKLFDSDSKFNSGSGWPSFDRPIKNNAVKEILDKSHGMLRREIVCNTCGSHLGHVFSDGPTKTGERYCINSICLDFKKKKTVNKK